MLSFKKRIIPRTSVLKVLESKGLIKDDKLVAPSKVYEKIFLNKFSHCFEVEASKLLKLYEEKTCILI
jgi:mTERF domain-containing protein